MTPTPTEVSRALSFSNVHDYLDVIQFAKRVFYLQNPDWSKTPDAPSTNGPNPLLGTPIR
jgi:hypothetical protein